MWDIVGPAARPVKLEALSRKRLAVDASIWIYQFLKAVRDKDGNSLSLSHIVGFFRRICKLLYFGILPMFVFDGGAPALKRRVIQERRERRQGNQEDATSTAQKLLAIQLQNKNKPKPKEKLKQTAKVEDEDMNYLEDMPNLHPEHHVEEIPSVESTPQRKFVKKDEYHLPELKQFTVSKDDSRVMPITEFNQYADDMNFDVVDGIDVDSVDPSSEEFQQLPLATQYMVLSHLRLRSRLRMGYTRDQLEGLFPNSKDFLRFQIEQVKKRNFYTQKLMTVSGMSEDSGNITRRIAGDKDRQYALVKNDDGWTLSLGGNDEVVELDDNGDVVENELGDKRSTLMPAISDNKLALQINRKSALPQQQQQKVQQTVQDNPDSDSDVSFEDVEISGDSDVDKAVVASIYDMYKDDYTDKELELQKAVEESRREYMQNQEEEAQLKKQFESATGESGFDLGQSVLFGAPAKPTKSAELAKPAEPKAKEPEKPENPEKINLEIMDEPEEPEAEKEATPEPLKPMPSWFDDGVSQIDSVHKNTGFIVDKPDQNGQINDDDGLIPWSEAKDLLEQKEESESDLELVEVNEPKTEDVEEISPEDAKPKEPVPEVPKEQTEEPTEEVKEPETQAQKEEEAKQQLPEKTQKRVEVLDYDFEEQDEEELVKLLREEEYQHAAFANEMKVKHNVPSLIGLKITEEQLFQERVLKAKRDSDEVDQTMINDVQELLKRFGLPYITAPMEAEAQCAELYQLGLVDGIVTDDSDCFLFGGLRIYKNMFNQKQYVECYFAEEVSHKVGLDRTKMIELALLLGSDYTTGVKGIGPVLAMEILAEFGDLKLFKAWYDEHKHLTKKDPQDSSTKKTLLSRIRNGKLFLPDSFPDQVVFDAYTKPEVESDDSAFKWGVPNLDQIRSFLMYNVGWSQDRVDEVMIPLIRDMNKKRAEGTQSTIGEFFPQEYISYKKEVGMGKRMKVAADRLSRAK